MFFFIFRYISLKFMEPDMTKGKLSANGVEIKRRCVLFVFACVYYMTCSNFGLKCT